MGEGMKQRPTNERGRKKKEIQRRTPNSNTVRPWAPLGKARDCTVTKTRTGETKTEKRVAFLDTKFVGPYRTTMYQRRERFLCKWMVFFCFYKKERRHKETKSEEGSTAI